MHNAFCQHSRPIKIIMRETRSILLVILPGTLTSLSWQSQHLREQQQDQMLRLPGHLYWWDRQNLNTRLTEHKRATRNGDLNNNIAEHHLQTNHRIDWDSAEWVIYSTDYYQRLTLESWFTYLEQMLLNRCQQLPAPYKRLINDTKTDKQ